MKAGSSTLRDLRERACLTMAALLAATAVMAGSGASAAGPDLTADPATLNGQGTFGVYQEIVNWQNDMLDAKSPVDVEYTASGTVNGRQGLLSGAADFALSGLPFTSDELTAAGKTAGDFISAPVQVESLAFLYSLPPTGLNTVTGICADPEQNAEDPDCLDTKPYTGPLNIPPVDLAAMAVSVATTVNGLAQNAWNQPDLLRAFGLDPAQTFLQPGGIAKPLPVLRSDGDADMYYLQQYVQSQAPSVWATLTAAPPPGVSWEPITERLPRTLIPSRQGTDQQTLMLGNPNTNPDNPGAGASDQLGLIAAAPASSFAAVHEAFPNVQLRLASVMNANGEFVAPTTDSINKAVAAGADTADFALANKVPGAYPLAWVNRLYAPAKGLSVAKTEAMASLIRYLATAGQGAAPPVGEGQLTPALTAQSLQAADDLVKSNCVGSDRQIVTSSDPGPAAPALPALAAVGPMLHCVPSSGAPDTPTTNDGPPVDVEPQGFSFFDTPNFDTSFDTPTGTETVTSTPLPPADTEVSADGVVEETGSGSPGRPRIAGHLPLPMPGGSQTFDHLGAIALSAFFVPGGWGRLRRFVVRAGR